MNILNKALAATLLISSSYVTAIPFSSGVDDVCTDASCLTTSDTRYTWVDPVNTPLQGASWVQTENSWHIDDSQYSLYEFDLSNSTEYNLTSLFVSFDDDLTIAIGDDVIFDSTLTNITGAWKAYFDVFAYSSFDTYISSEDNLTFSVKNSGNGATGVIWNGTVSIPEPSTILIFAFALLALVYIRKINTKN